MLINRIYYDIVKFSKKFVSILTNIESFFELFAASSISRIAC